MYACSCLSFYNYGMLSQVSYFSFFSQMSRIMESTLAHSRAVVSKGEAVIWLSPAQSLSGGEDGLLDLLVVVTNLSVLAPARLVLALRAVVASIGGLVLHLEDVVEATRVSLGVHLLSGRLLDSLGSTEVIDVGVLLI